MNLLLSSFPTRLTVALTEAPWCWWLGGHWAKSGRHTDTPKTSAIPAGTQE